MSIKKENTHKDHSGNIENENPAPIPPIPVPRLPRQRNTEAKHVRKSRSVRPMTTAPANNVAK